MATTKPTPRKELIYLTVADWEFGCCGDIPAVGGTVKGWVRGYSRAVAIEFSPAVDRWDTDLEIIYMGSFAAGWHPSDWHVHNNPLTGPIGLGVTWHGGSDDLDPHIEGEIIELYEHTVEYELSDNTWRPIEGTDAFRAVETAPRYTSRTEDRDPAKRYREYSGVVMGVRVNSETLPTPEERERQRIKRDIDARSLRITGPADAFGETVPAIGDALTIDLADPRLTFRGYRGGATAATERTGLRPVRGTVYAQVSTAHPRGDGRTSYRGIEPGTPASDVEQQLKISFTIDADEFVETA